MIENTFEFKIYFESLTVFRNILNDSVIKSLKDLITCIDKNDVEYEEIICAYTDFYHKFSSIFPLDSLRTYLIKAILYNENAFSRIVEKRNSEILESNLARAVENDLVSLQKIASLNAKDIKEFILKIYNEDGFRKNIIWSLPEWSFEDDKLLEHEVEIVNEFKTAASWKDCMNGLTSFYKRYGSGKLAKYKGFVWDNKEIKGITQADPVKLSELIGYDAERKEVIDNTICFLRGYPANNILLYGDRGTGKSSTVKALLNEYYEFGLRIVEVPKAYLGELPDVIRAIKDRAQKFILFIDDLAFEDNEECYTALKAALEGGLECRTKNIVIYATSNRRHLIKEKFSERAGLMSDNHDDEIRARDTIQEKLSLADRFGITVTFSLPDKNKYLEIVEGIAKSRNLEVDKDFLHKEAMKWEIMYNGRSPRTAKQFIDWLEGRLSMPEKEAK